MLTTYTDENQNLWGVCDDKKARYKETKAQPPEGKGKWEKTVGRERNKISNIDKCHCSETAAEGFVYQKQFDSLLPTIAKSKRGFNSLPPIIAELKSGFKLDNHYLAIFYDSKIVLFDLVEREDSNSMFCNGLKLGNLVNGLGMRAFLQIVFGYICTLGDFLLQEPCKADEVLASIHIHEVPTFGQLRDIQKLLASLPVILIELSFETVAIQNKDKWLITLLVKKYQFLHVKKHQSNQLKKQEDIDVKADEIDYEMNVAHIRRISQGVRKCSDTIIKSAEAISAPELIPDNPPQDTAGKETDSESNAESEQFSARQQFVLDPNSASQPSVSTSCSHASNAESSHGEQFSARRQFVLDPKSASQPSVSTSHSHANAQEPRISEKVETRVHNPCHPSPQGAKFSAKSVTLPPSVQDQSQGPDDSTHEKSFHWTYTDPDWPDRVIPALATTEPPLNHTNMRQRMQDMSYRLASMVHISESLHADVTELAAAKLYYHESKDEMCCCNCAWKISRVHFEKLKDPRRTHACSQYTASYSDSRSEETRAETASPTAQASVGTAAAHNDSQEAEAASSVDPAAEGNEDLQLCPGAHTAREYTDTDTSEHQSCTEEQTLTEVMRADDFQTTINSLTSQHESIASVENVTSENMSAAESASLIHDSDSEKSESEHQQRHRTKVQDQSRMSDIQGIDEDATAVGYSSVGNTASWSRPFRDRNSAEHHSLSDSVTSLDLSVIDSAVPDNQCLGDRAFSEAHSQNSNASKSLALSHDTPSEFNQLAPNVDETLTRHDQSLTGGDHEYPQLPTENGLQGTSSHSQDLWSTSSSAELEIDINEKVSTSPDITDFQEMSEHKGFCLDSKAESELISCQRDMDDLQTDDGASAELYKYSGLCIVNLSSYSCDDEVAA